MKELKKRIRRQPWGIYFILTIAALGMLIGGYKLGRASVPKQVEAKPTMVKLVAEPTMASPRQIASKLEVVEPAEPALISLGEFKLTHYCPCEKCCGDWADGITYTGTQATEGRTIAVDPDTIPLGSTVVIDGQEYIAEDIGGAIQGNRIDVFMDSHQAALEGGVKHMEVFIYE